jgi:hypothetical protein
MSCRSDEEDNPAPSPPGFYMPTKVEINDGACHAGSDANGTEADSYLNVEKQVDESTGKKRNYNPYLQYTEIKRWPTCTDSLLEPAQINQEIYTLMKKYMHQSRLIRNF